MDKFIVKEKDELYNYLRNNLNKSKNNIKSLLKNECILVNNNIVTKYNYIVKTGDIIEINKSKRINSELDIIYEDDWMIIVNKPAGIAVHPSILHYDDSLSNGIKSYFNTINLHKKIRPVNRLDRNTSGLVLFAKCEYIQECLIKQMQANTFKKEYLAICNGIFDKNHGIIDLPIARKENSIIERCISENGQKSITHYKVLKEFNNYSLVNCTLETGRTHQIRVHMAAIGHPLIGDSLYGTISDFIDRQALHCYKLHFVHPVTKCSLDFFGDLPSDFKIFDF